MTNNELREIIDKHSANNAQSDLISRADAVKAMRELLGELGERAEIALNCLTGYVPSVSADSDDRLCIKVYADDEPSVKAEKLYRICGETQNREVAKWLKEYFPSAERVGEWIWCGDKGDSRFMCSVCKSKENVPTCMGEPSVWDYCPNCGARMESKK